MTPVIENLSKLLGGPRDSALLRYSLGIEYLRAGDPETAARRLHEAVERDPHYSAAWKGLGRALAEAGRFEDAQAAYREGIEAASRNGDIQAAKEMQVFLRRVQRQIDHDQHG